ncbi:BamA/TamA family outer membrane protein [Nibribacter ruber]|uniref:BamA/TamA family outer membrane protein n=1 Tax=Nibribacter ruber TaxID=2698458 RepID=A0A6P1P1U0_9BACT|nr:BamA/TamA family outer membrane protein [Nibribacter ruber]QHL87812.1 BamA/TamA family outer membrane protein [Nibribacter ruber]
MRIHLPRWVVRLSIVTCTLLPVRGWAQTPSLPSSEVTHTVLLAGRWAPNQTSAAPLPLLQTQLQQAGKKSTLVFIGNPFQPATLPGVAAPDRPVLEEKLRAQLQYLQGFEGKVVVMPGEHDAKGKVVQEVRNQERYLSQVLGNDKLILPENACPGPTELAVTDDVHLLLLDTQWLMPNRRMDDKEEMRGCETVGGTATMAAVDDVLRSNEEKNLLVIMSVSPEMKGLEYKLMHRQLAQMYTEHAGLIHAEGNSPALQHRTKDSIHYVSTGLGASNMKPVKDTHPAYASNTPGFAKILYLANGETWLEIWTASDVNSAQGQVAYRAKLSQKPTTKQLQEKIQNMNLSFTGKTATLPASQVYKASKFREWLLGTNYRPEWSTPVTLPLFDIGAQKGGLKVVQRGGGFQTVSLRLEDSTGRQYVLRSVEKYPDAALPAVFRKTIAADVVKDQISASHPYGSLVVTPLADAAGVYHTNPQYFAIPNDPRFGRYLKGFANTIGLFEERPDEDMSDVASMGNAKNVVGTDKVLENTREDQNDQVDQMSLLRARLFDFFIADWDRHDDQWRWAEFKKDGKGKVYKAIPRDRDQAFFVNQGVIPNIASRKWILPKVQGFDESLRDIEGFNFNNRNFDRSFLTGLERADWIAMADSVKASFTDEAIDNAVRQLPDNIYKISGQRLASTLKARRAYIRRDAEDYYEFLAKQVDVAGTDEAEFFEVQRQQDGTTVVSVFKKDSATTAYSPKDRIYQRRFLPAETDEVRLYGLGGNDHFVVKGQGQEGIRVRIIGGNGQDQVIDSSNVEGLRRLTYIYDQPDGITIQAGTEARNLTRHRPTPTYDRLSYKYDYLGPLASFQFNRDDGFLLGGGVLLEKQGFQKQPFAMRHRLVGSYAFATRSFLVDYAGHFTRVRLGLDLKLNVNFKSPGFSDNFFGFSNESEYNPDIDIEYYRYRSSQLYVNALAGRKLGEHATFFAGPAYQAVNVERTPERFLSTLTTSDKRYTDYNDPKAYAGARLEYELDSRDVAALPAKGMHWVIGADLMKGTKATSQDFGRINSELSLYQTVRIPFKLTLATRFGGGHTFGDDFEFFQGQHLDGLNTLRGYRRTRFTGQTSFYNNTEARLRLFTFTTYLFPATVGVFGFHDVGRVWVDGENSKDWHTGYGGGVWFAPVNQVVISLGYTVSEEDKLPLIKAGFFF